MCLYITLQSPPLYSRHHWLTAQYHCEPLLGSLRHPRCLHSVQIAVVLHRAVEQDNQAISTKYLPAPPPPLLYVTAHRRQNVPLPRQ